MKFATNPKLALLIRKKPVARKPKDIPGLDEAHNDVANSGTEDPRAPEQESINNLHNNNNYRSRREISQVRSESEQPEVPIRQSSSVLSNSTEIGGTYTSSLWTTSLIGSGLITGGVESHRSVGPQTWPEPTPIHHSSPLSSDDTQIRGLYTSCLWSIPLIEGDSVMDVRGVKHSHSSQRFPTQISTAECVSKSQTTEGEEADRTPDKEQENVRKGEKDSGETVQSEDVFNIHRSQFSTATQRSHSTNSDCAWAHGEGYTDDLLLGVEYSTHEAGEGFANCNPVTDAVNDRETNVNTLSEGSQRVSCTISQPEPERSQNGDIVRILPPAEQSSSNITDIFSNSQRNSQQSHSTDSDAEWANREGVTENTLGDVDFREDEMLQGQISTTTEVNKGLVHLDASLERITSSSNETPLVEQKRGQGRQIGGTVTASGENSECNTQHSHSTNSDAAWANKEGIMENLLMDMESDNPPTEERFCSQVPLSQAADERTINANQLPEQRTAAPDGLSLPEQEQAREERISKVGTVGENGKCREVTSIPPFNLGNPTQPPNRPNPAHLGALRESMEIGPLVAMGADDDTAADAIQDHSLPTPNLIRTSTANNENEWTSRGGVIDAVWQDHDYLPMRKMSPLHYERSSQYSNSTYSDGLWANQGGLTDVGLFMDGDENSHQAIEKTLDEQIPVTNVVIGSLPTREEGSIIPREPVYNQRATEQRSSQEKQMRMKIGPGFNDHDYTLMTTRPPSRSGTRSLQSSSTNFDVLWARENIRMDVGNENQDKVPEILSNPTRSTSTHSDRAHFLGPSDGDNSIENGSIAEEVSNFSEEYDIDERMYDSDDSRWSPLMGTADVVSNDIDDNRWAHLMDTSDDDFNDIDDNDDNNDNHENDDDDNDDNRWAHLMETTDADFNNINDNDDNRRAHLMETDTEDVTDQRMNAEGIDVDPTGEPVVTTRIKRPKKKLSEFDPESRSIVKFCHILKQLQNLFVDGLHGREGCTINNLIQIGEIHHGLRTKWVFNCNMCNRREEVWSELEVDNQRDVNRSAVLAICTIGEGQEALHHVTTTMGLHYLNKKIYKELSEPMNEEFIEIAEEDMKQNGIEERRLALEANSVVDGIATYSVITDGSWPKRSYGKGGVSQSGMAVGVGERSKKVLFAGYKNRYCYVCEVAANAGKPALKHKCWVNYPKNKSILGTESTVITEEFCKSIEKHNLIYARMIGDGDSSSYNKVLEANPYPDRVCVEKSECPLHYARLRLREILAIVRAMRTGRSEDLKALKKFFYENMGRICKGVNCAAKHWSTQLISEEEKIIKLQRDVLNVIPHVFGNHVNCAEYFCDGAGKPNERNWIPLLEESQMFEQVQAVMQKWADFAYHLLLGKTANLAEAYNSVLAKFIYGKRVNIQQRGLYPARIAMAVIQFDRQNVASSYHEKIGMLPPPGLLQMEEEHRAKNIYNKKYRKTKRMNDLAPGETENTRQSGDYGRNSQKPDMSPEVYEKAVERHWQALHEWQRDRDKKEKVTRGNEGNKYLLRKKLLVPHHFGRLFRMRNDTPTALTVKNILYPPVPLAVSKNYGQRCKNQIKAQYDQLQPCGMIIDAEIPFLAAEPDGLLGDDTILMIHCPYNLRDKTIEEAMRTPKLLKSLKLLFRITDDKISALNPISHLYYEIVGSLAITRRKICRFVLTTDVNNLTMDIECNDQFRSESMVTRFRLFYEEHMIPEIVDGRHPRSMTLRDNIRSGTRAADGPTTNDTFTMPSGSAPIGSGSNETSNDIIGLNNGCEAPDVDIGSNAFPSNEACRNFVFIWHGYIQSIIIPGRNIVNYIVY